MSAALLLALLVTAVGGQSDDDLLAVVQNQAAVIDSLTARLTAVENQLGTYGCLSVRRFL